MLPLIGVLKNAGKAGELAQSILSYGEEISDVLKALPSGADEAAGLIGGLAKTSDEVGELAQGVIRYGDEVEGAAGEILPRVTKALRKIAADEPWLPANWKEQIEEGWAAGGYEEKAAATGAENVINKLPKTTEESVRVKLDNYLLDPDHPAGGSKAKWFKEALGFTKDNSTDLANQIVFDPQRAVQTVKNEYGTKFSQTISVHGANGKIIDIEFIFIKNNDGAIRLVTSIPTKR